MSNRKCFSIELKITKYMFVFDCIYHEFWYYRGGGKKTIFFPAAGRSPKFFFEKLVVSRVNDHAEHEYLGITQNNCSCPIWRAINMLQSWQNFVGMGFRICRSRKWNWFFDIILKIFEIHAIFECFRNISHAWRTSEIGQLSLIG